jgi:hypothetical protein
VLPYDDPPWEYTENLVKTLRRYEALRLTAKYAGGFPERLAELSQCKRLYLSRYKGFAFEFMSRFLALEFFELDYGSIVDLDGVQKLDLSILKLTECRKLERIDALAECRSVKFLSLALCNAVIDHAPIGAMKDLESLFIEARELESIEFLKELRNLRSVAFGVESIAASDLEPLFALDDLRHVAIRKKLAKPKDVQRMRERWPDAEIAVD